MKKGFICLFALFFFFAFSFISCVCARADVPAGVKEQYQYNEQDSSIITVKKRLQELGYYRKNTPFSDVVSESMKEIVVSFQHQNGMQIDGVIDKEFLERLFSDQAVKADGKAISRTETNQKKTVSGSSDKKDSQSGSVPLGLVIFLCAIVIILVLRVIISSSPRNYEIQKELARVDNMDGVSFERWCGKLLEQLGYRNVKMTRATGDFGADILCKYNGVKTVVQCKRYGKALGLKPVQEVLGAKSHYGAGRMMVMTNNYFTTGARRLASDSGVILWDRKALMDWMRQVNKLKGKSPKNEKEDIVGLEEESQTGDSDTTARIKNEYSVTVRRLYDNSTYVLYREADSENDAMKMVNSVIKENDVIVDVQLIRHGIGYG